MTKFSRSCMISLICTILGGLSPIAGHLKAQEPLLNIPEVALSGTLLDVHLKQIESRLKYYAQLIRDAKDQKPIDQGRDGLIKTYNYYKSPTFRFAVAQLAAKTVTPLLDINSKVKQISTAIALANMPEVAIQPALEKMIAHQNAGVRYIGWRGYRMASARILAHSLSASKQMFDSLAKRAEQESSAPVMEAIWEMLRPYPSTVKAPKGLEDPRKLSLKILRQSWHKQCRKVLRGNLQMLDAARKGLITALEYAAIADVTGDKKTATEAVQMAAELMWCAGKIYKTASDRGKAASPIKQMAETLLRECEKSFNGLLSLRAHNKRDYISVPLTYSAIKPEDRGDAVMYYMHPRTNKKYGVHAWLDELKKRYNIEKPTKKTFQPKTPASQPAKKPATE